MIDQEEQMKFSRVIVVDENDNQIGICSKLDAHKKGSEKLHRAFSLFLFNDEGKLLIQQRSSNKLTFPNIWANSCCSHPEPDEDIIHAAIRRSKFELNIDLDDSNHLTEIQVFKYKADWKEWTEFEVDHVIFGYYTNNSIKPISSEVQDVKWVTNEDFSRMISENPDCFSPWLQKIYHKWLKEIWGQWVEHTLQPFEDKYIVTPL